MTRYAAVMVVLAAAAWAQTGAAKIAGAWHGTLGAGAAHLEIVVHIRRNAGGGLEVTLDSPAQGVRGLQGRGAKLAGNHFSFAVPAVHGAYSGTVAGNRQSIHGTWSQGAPMTLNLTRGAGAAVSAPAPAMLPARPPIPVAQLRPALDAEMQPLFARHTALGLVIGIYENGAERVFAYGAARPESMFEIGSITKSFTGLVLARMVEQHQASLDEPLTGLLPNCWRGPQRGCAARPAYARVGLGALGPSPTLRLAGAAPACFP
ncbi:MAG: serine hydrolase, partial [Terriglobales bacterium]